MQAPSELGVVALKKLARYFIGKPRLVYKCNWQGVCGIDVFNDTDCAG